MARPPSKIMTINGKEYRVTPYDPRHEERCAHWNRKHMRVISTRVPREVYAALEDVCDRERTTVYALMQTLVAQRLQAANKSVPYHSEWLKTRN